MRQYLLHDDRKQWRPMTLCDAQQVLSHTIPLEINYFNQKQLQSKKQY